jgi:hypothetical protein
LRAALRRTTSGGMDAPDCLKLAAIDEEDLAIVSAYVQDAVLKVGDMVYLPKERRFALAMNRFTWEKAEDGSRRDYERRRAALTFDRVTSVRTNGIDRGRRDEVLELLAVAFDPVDPPAGRIMLIFAGGGVVQVNVEVIEARLADLGAAWATKAKPRHDIEIETKAGA